MTLITAAPELRFTASAISIWERPSPSTHNQADSARSLDTREVLFSYLERRFVLPLAVDHLFFPVPLRRAIRTRR